MFCLLHLLRVSLSVREQGSKEKKEGRNNPGGLVVNGSPTKGAKPRRPVTPFGSRRADSSHSRIPCGRSSAATIAAAPCSPIQPTRVFTFFVSPLYRSSQQFDTILYLQGVSRSNFLASK